MKLEELGELDNWICWVCDNEVDPRAIQGSAHAASIDHIVPRAKGGKNEDDNVRLAHRKCNSNRGSSFPELEWPNSESLVEAAPLWPALQSLMKRPNTSQRVAFFISRSAAEAASAWTVGIATRLTGEPWQAEVDEITSSTYAVNLRVAT